MRVHIDFLGCFDIKKQYSGLLRELEAYRANSVLLRLDGIQSTPSDIAEACFIYEDGCYMREYTGDENAALLEVSFCKVEVPGKEKSNT